MTLLEEAEKLVEDLREGYSFWDMVLKAAESPHGHVIIRPDFIGIGEVEDDTINVWLAIGDNGVRKALELAPPSVTKAAWRRGILGDNEIKTYDIHRLKRLYERHISRPS